MRFLFAVCIGVAGTLGWQNYGDQVRETLAVAYPQLNWLAPRPASAQTVVTTTSAPGRSSDAQQFEQLTLRISDMRQRVDMLSQQLSATQDQISARLQTAERDILDKIAVAQQPPPPRQEAVTVRRAAPAVQTLQPTQLR